MQHNEDDNNLVSNMIQKYNNNLLSEDPTTNNVGLPTGPTNNERYNLRHNKRDYGKCIGKVDGANDFTFIQGQNKKDKDTIWFEAIHRHIALA